MFLVGPDIFTVSGSKVPWLPTPPAFSRFTKFTYNITRYNIRYNIGITHSNDNGICSFNTYIYMDVLANNSPEVHISLPFNFYILEFLVFFFFLFFSFLFFFTFREPQPVDALQLQRGI